MFRFDHTADFKLIFEEDHIKKVLLKISQNFPEYFQRIIRNHRSDGFHQSGLEALKAKFNVKGLEENNSDIVENFFSEGINNFIKERKHYLEIYNEEYLTDIPDKKRGEIRQIFKSRCPVIRKSFKSKSPVMNQWKTDFNETDEKEIIDAFLTLIEFSDTYLEDINEDKVNKIKSWKDFNLSEVDEEEYGVLGVIGTGIKSIVLHNISPRYFPRKSQNSMYALFFLTSCEHFELRSSEFLMIDKQKMSQNYWYPYNLFSFYALNIYELINNEFKELNIEPNVNFRYVYVNTFFDYVCSENRKYISTMLVNDEY